MFQNILYIAASVLAVTAILIGYSVLGTILIVSIVINQILDGVLEYTKKL